MRGVNVNRMRYAACVAAVLQSACAGNGDGLDANGRPIDEGGAVGVLVPTLESIQANVFTPICTQCHVGANAPQGLRLDAASSYGLLVGVSSSEVQGLLRVEPGNPGASYLVQKLEGRAAAGARMPLGQPALPSDTIQVIRQWILDGAQRATSDSQTPLAVAAVSASKTEIAVALSRPVDASLVSSTTVRLKRVDPDGNETGSIPVDVAVSRYNDALLVARPREALRAGTYRLLLLGTGPVALADWNAVPLDGDGDGLAGGDARIDLVMGDVP